MGRELRMVPPNWEHPKYGEHRKNRDSIYYCRAANTPHRDDDCYMSLYDGLYKNAAESWIKDFIEWHVKGKKDSDISEYYWEYAGNPPDEAYYRAYNDNEAIWYQLYETVSEGTPVSPPFAKKEELIEYLCTKGDFWQQSDKEKGDTSFRGENYSRKAAEYMVSGGYAPSMIMSDGKLYGGAEGMVSISTEAKLSC